VSPRFLAGDEVPGGAGRGPVLRVLVVDDDADTVNTLTEILRTEGYEVRGHCSAVEALKTIEDFDPDVVISDIAMPLMSGWDFLTVQQGNAAFASIPVLMLSARGASRHDGLNCKPAAYLEKPIDLNSLLAAIRQHYAVSVGTVR